MCQSAREPQRGGRSLVLLGTQAGVAVRDEEAQLVRALDDLLPLLRPDVV
eukprot:CAMPEP_0197872186 /NCGR_PEP_ID=MMETSP1439-20131203/2361_1 /TAXON_ID=66791 /ORGANISM="Gonyaulax spinifera, Strain CCMP409" /LENGTH=49 /DNA_ID= /DNA_START= /DNA_END= /DNA_ORIENTATION=